MGMKLALVLAFVYKKNECEGGNFVLSIWLCKLQISNSINRLLGWMMWGQIGIWSWKESYWFISWWRNGIVWRQQTNFFVGKIDGLEKSILLESSRHKEAMESSGGGDRKGHFRVQHTVSWVNVFKANNNRTVATEDFLICWRRTASSWAMYMDNNGTGRWSEVMRWLKMYINRKDG